MTIDQMKLKKAALEAKLYQELVAFENSTGIQVGTITITRTADGTCSGAKVCVVIQL